MLLVLQYPIADVRGFLPDAGGRLGRPAWPVPVPGTDFIRSTGLVKRRRRGGASEWAGEEVYGDAAKVVRFPYDLWHRTSADDQAGTGIRCLFRRYYCEGVVARLEVGLRVSADTHSKPARFLDILRRVLNGVVAIRSATGKPRMSRLIEAGPFLADHFLQATTAHRSPSSAEPLSWWLSCGTPAVFLQHGQGEALLPLPHSRHVLDVTSEEAALRHSWLEVDSQRCSTWLLSTGATCTDQLRRLRLHVSRLHAELECLRVVLTHLVESDRFRLSRNECGTEALQSYLSKSIQLVQRPRRGGWSQCEVMSAARQALARRLEGEMTSLLSFRRQISQKVRLYARDANRHAMVTDYMKGASMGTQIQIGDLTVKGDFNLVTESHIQNSFHKAAGAAAFPELRQKLLTLTVAVAKLADKLPPQQAEQVTKDLDGLSSEAISTHPRRQWYELSARGIIDAARMVADLTAPVATAIEDVLSILGSASK